MAVRLRPVLGLLFALCAVGAGGYLALNALDKAYPPPLPQRLTTSTEVHDRDGLLLRAYPVPGGTWRLNTSMTDVDPHLVEMLVAYEDKRFFTHSGVDLLAIARAGWQLLTHGRIVSGGSTISMQVARLIEPRKERSFASKLLQVARALQIERRLSKQEILERYLTLAPYGGNLEGVRAASLSYFNKEPKRLSLAEAALLVALPQLPELRRPDRHLLNAKRARDRVLLRLVGEGIVDQREIETAQIEVVPKLRHPLPALAAHISDRAVKAKPSAAVHHLTLKRDAQARLEAVTRSSVAALGQKVSVAMILADSRNGNILASIGSPDYFDSARHGWIDMTRIIRSPGSTLKPFIYGLAFDDGLIAQQTIIEDRPQDFSGYRPRNFDLSYQGDVTIRQALQMSLNVPAIALLDAVGPTKMTARLKQAGLNLRLPRDASPSLAIGLGGVGLTLQELVQAYTALANGGEPSLLRDGTELTHAAEFTGPILSPIATWHLADILAGVNPPIGAPKINIAYKTGTSYGYRDAWSIGYDGRYVLGVWVGRPDGGAVPGLTGYSAAAPILFEAFSKSGIPIQSMPRAPAGALRTAAKDLPITQIRFDPDMTPATSKGHLIGGQRPQIINMANGTRIDFKDLKAAAAPLVLRLNGGRPPFRWIANGTVLAEHGRTRRFQWMPTAVGETTLTVIDSAGQASSVMVYIE